MVLGLADDEEMKGKDGINSDGCHEVDEMDVEMDRVQ